MKIDLLINSLNGGGAERVMATLANGFSDKGYKIRLITFNEGNAFPINSDVKRIELHGGFLKNHTLRSLINLFKFYLKNNNKPHILVAFMPTTNLIAILISIICNIKVIVSEHNNHKANYSTQNKWIRKLFYRFADSITVLTKFDVPFFEKLGAKVTVMPNPVEIPLTTKEYNDRENNILVAGSLKRYKTKGFDTLLNTIAPVLNQFNNWKLIIAGSGEPGMTTLKEIVKELDIEDKVIFTGFTNELPTLMQNSKVYVLSSKFEGLPMVLMEALSNGMSCIAYNCVSGPSELIDDNFNGILIEDQNSSAMSKGITALLEDDKLRNRLANNATISVEKFSTKNVIIMWENLIDSVLNNER